MKALLITADRLEVLVSGIPKGAREYRRPILEKIAQKIERLEDFPISNHARFRTYELVGYTSSDCLAVPIFEEVGE